MTESKNKKSGTGFIMWVTYGMVFGAALGIFLGNIALGAGMGIVIGAAGGAIFGFEKNGK